MNLVRRTLAAAAASGTALAVVSLASTPAAQAATRVATHLAISAPHRVAYGASVTVTGKLTYTRHHHRHAVSGETVTLRERNSHHGKWTTVGTATTITDGSVTFTPITVTRTEQVRLVYKGDKTTTPAYRRSVSKVRTIKVAYAVSATQATAGANPVAVTVMPNAPRKKVEVQLLKGKHWVTSQTARLNSGSMATITVRLPRKAKAGTTYTYRVEKPASHRYLKGVSADFTLTAP